MKKQLFQILGLAVIAVITTIMSLSYLNSGNAFGFNLGTSPSKQESVQAPILREARQEFQKAKEAQTDFSQSPCLNNSLPTGYALDIIHNPRIVADDQTQCPRNDVGLVEIYPSGEIANITRY
ncbi:MAG: hypothetical protein KatS3mg087_0366 [Patescibacteria group bacterium]|jgi:hypothetical protein|nr:MAG: hypothetical protein KatS3mg087_0366 [Patescibacteria group bacterium]